jgi:uncharacterized OB-fold protein
MAKYVIPKPSHKTTIIKCEKCSTLYVPETGDVFYEKCPTCGYAYNSEFNKISLWRYNLIKWLRGGFKE